MPIKQFESNLDKPLDYNEEYHLTKFGNWVKIEGLYNIKGEVAKRNIFSYDFNEDSKVLEVGAGIGQITAWIKNKHAFELNKKMYPFLKNKGFKTYNHIKEVPDNYFDEIVMSMVLEHIENPVEFINKWKQKLKVGGKIRLALPSAYYNKMENMNASNNGHYFCWGFPDINYLLNRCGFKVVYNKKVYRRGIDRVYFLSKIGFWAYWLAIRIMGRIANNFDIIVIANKIKK